MSNDQKLLKIPEVADFLDVSPARAYQLARDGIIPVVRLGRQLRVHPSALEEWIRSGGQGLREDKG